MTKPDRAAAGVLTALLLTQVLVVGPALSMTGVFMTPLIRAFHCTHQQVAELAFTMTITGALLSPFVGWLMDRVGGQFVMAAGIVLMASGYWCSSLVHSLHAMMLCSVIFGAGLMLDGVMVVMVVAVNWFGKRRATAGGLLWVALALGLGITPPTLTWIIFHHGWQAGFRWLSLPSLCLMLPLTLFLIRTRPRPAPGESVGDQEAALPGLDLLPALREPMFWLVLLASVLFALGFYSVFVHEITYLISLGFTPQHAALINSAQVIVSAFGALGLGQLADRLGTRPVLCIALLGLGIGVAAFAAASQAHWATPALALFVLGCGVGAGSVPPLLQVLLAETVGLRRFGSLAGIVGFVATLGNAVGPVLMGRAFDLTGSYVPGLLVAAAMLPAAALAVALVRPPQGLELPLAVPLNSA